MQNLTPNQKQIERTVKRSMRFASWIKHLGGFRGMEFISYTKALLHLNKLHSKYQQLENNEDR